MDGSMAEGISTSLQHSPHTSSPCDLQGLDAPDSSSFSSQLCVHDPGLTLSPGPQRERAENTSCVRGIAGTSASLQARADDSSEGDIRKVYVDAVSGYGTTVSDNLLAPGDFRSPSADGVMPTDVSVGDVETAAIPDPDPLFESKFNLEDLEALFYNRKRSGPDAADTEHDLLHPPEKRARIEAPADENNGPFERTPSLSSPGSSRVSQPSETVLNTPAHIERLQTPDSLFDTQEPLIADEALFPAWESEDPAPDKAMARPFELDESASTFDIPGVNLTDSHGLGEHPPPAADGIPTRSQITKQKFSLDAQDLLAASMREVLHRPNKPPEYSSPYPRADGPVGYLPSSPALHVRFIEVTEEASRKRIAKCLSDIKRLENDCDKYRRAWVQALTFGPVTGKAPDRVHKEEVSRLRRECTKQKRTADGFKWDAERFRFQADNWQGAYRNLAITYNRLLSDYQQLHRTMAVPPQPSMGTSQSCVSSTHATSNAPATRRPPPAQAVDAVTIDLTGGPPEPESNPSSRPPTSKGDGTQLLETFRKKNYSWLTDSGHAGGVSSQTSALPSTSPGTRMPPSDEDELARLMEQELAQG